MSSRRQFCPERFRWLGAFIILFIFLFGGLAHAQVTLTFDFSQFPPLEMDITETTWIRIDVSYSDSDFDTLFLFIPNKPDFFTFWRQRREPGPRNEMHDKIIFKPGLQDGGQYIFPIIAGGIRADGTVIADTFYYELRVKPFIFAEPEYSGGTSNTISWMRSDSLYDQWVYLLDPLHPDSPIPGNRLAMAKTNSSGEIIRTTFENLENNVRYGYFIKGFTADSVVTHSDTLYSIQDSDLPEYLDSSFGHEAPARSVDLYWYPVSDPTSYVQGYVIYRRTDLEPFTAIDTVFVARGQNQGRFHYWDSPTDLVEGEKYFYKIVALDAGFNVGDGMEIGPFIPDRTPPPPPVFRWELGYGFDFELGYPVKDLPDQGYTEKSWFKQGRGNTVYVFNPSSKPEFSGLARADSVRFQAVRDQSKFFEDEWQPGMQFFEKWSSPWVAIADFAGQDPSYTFDFSNGGANDDWFIHGHFYKFRAQYKDIAGNTSIWSRINPDSLLVGAFQDLFPPGDIANLNLFVEFDPAFAGGGYFRIEWEAASDSVSGVGKYYIYRKIGEDGRFVLHDSVLATDELVQRYNDSFGSIGRRAKTFYRIVPVDHVGNAGTPDATSWEVYSWPPLPPQLTLVDTLTQINENLYTTHPKVKVSWAGFDIMDVNRFVLYVNSDSLAVNPALFQYELALHEGENHIFARVQFANGLWSPMSNVLIVYKDSTAPSPIVNLQVTNDTSYTGNIYLHWAASIDPLAITYEVFRREKGVAAFTLLGSTADTSWIDPYAGTGGQVLKAFQHYEYKILPRDQLGNAADQNAGFGETYCNIAPKIKKFSFFDDSLSVFWTFPGFPDSSVVPFDSVRFDVYLFKGAVSRPISIGNAYRVDYVVGRNEIRFKIEPGLKYYAVARGVELKSSRLDSTAWSQPRLSDTGASIIPALDSLLTQAQPTDTTGIYVSWELYWQHPFWDTSPGDIVGFMEVLRWPVNHPDSVLRRVYYPGDVEFQNSGFMDRFDLTPMEQYVYQVIPYEKKTNDPPRFLPAGNQNAPQVNDTSRVTNFTDRVFIPKLNHIFAMNPNTGKKYFSTGDSLRFDWFWLFLENQQEREAPFGVFRGAAKIQLFVSNNPQFLNQPDFKRFTQVIELERKSLVSDSLFYFADVKDLTNPGTFNIYEGKSIFARIRGFDRWGHSPDYPSSADLDGVTELIYDVTPPTESLLSFQVKSSTDTSAGVPLVDILFQWTRSSDAISGLRDYTIDITMQDSLITRIGGISAQDTSYILEKFELKDEYFTRPLTFSIYPRDFAGNVNRISPAVEFRFFNPPQIIRAVRDTVTNNVELTWTKVPGADKYLIVFAVRKSYFEDPLLRFNPGNREEVIASASDPDTIRHLIKKYFNPDSTWYFRITAIKSDIYESGWSNFYLLPAHSQSGSGSTLTSVEDEQALPTTYVLKQNYPNPFNPATTIEYAIPHQTHVILAVYNLRGERVRTLVNRNHEPGRFRILWNGRNDQGELVASGVYIYKISTGDYTQVKKCLFIK